MNTTLANGLLSAFFIALFLSSCTDPKLKQQVTELQSLNDSLNTRLQECCECGPMPADLVEISEDAARLAWTRYSDSKEAKKIYGTWLDQGNLWYLTCTFRNNIYSGIGINDSSCAIVIYAVQTSTDTDKPASYRFFTLANESINTGCDNSKIDIYRTGTCPHRCP